MPTIFERPPVDIIENLELLSNDLDIKISLKKIDKNLLIASWNIRAFGNLTCYIFIKKALYSKGFFLVICINYYLFLFRMHNSQLINQVLSTT